MQKSKNIIPNFLGWLSVIFFLFICVTLPAQAGSNAGMAGAFLRMGLGARALAMGDVGVAIPGSGFGIYYNPASLPYLEKYTFLSSYTSLSLDRSLNFIGFTAPLNPPQEVKSKAIAFKAGVGIGWISAGSGDIDGRDFDGNPIGTFRFSENAFYFSFALKFSQYVSLGFTPTVLYSHFPDLLEGEKFSSSRLGFDAGLLVNPYQNLYLGAQARHLNAQYRWDTSLVWGDEGTTVTDEFPRIYRFGAAYLFPFGLTFAGDFETSDQEDNQIHLGAEYLWKDITPYQFALRAGYDDQNYAFGLGFGFLIWKLAGQLDYAYQLQDVPPFDTQIVSLSVSF